MHTTVFHSLRRIWRTHVWNDYRNGVIASERELQACLYLHLREELTATCAGHARIFVEPTVKNAPGTPRLFRRPDLIIAIPSDDQPHLFNAVAFVELKLDRGGYIVYEGELDRIERLGAHTSISIDDQRPARRASQITLTIDARTQFFLGFVGDNDAAAVHPEQVRSKDGGFAARNFDLAKRTTLLYGRVDSDGATLFGHDNFVASETL